MQESFADIFKAGGNMNSLGRADEVVSTVLQNKSKLQELYECMHHDDAWVRMRAVDSIEKVCRVHPEWIESYIDTLITDFSSSTQSSILWHLAQMYAQVKLTPSQKEVIIVWLKNLLSTKDIDWIVAANAMDTLARFTSDGLIPQSEALHLLEVQKQHKSNAVVKRATKLTEILQKPK